MALWQGQASNIPVKGTASIVVKVLQQSSYCSFALDPFVKTLWAWMMSVYSSGYKALMNLSLYICWWVICRSVVGWLGVGYPQVSCQICGDGGHPTIDCPQKHSCTDLGQVCSIGEMCNFLQLNPYEQAQAQRIAELQARLALLERQVAELWAYNILSLPLQTRVVLKCRFVANMCVNVYV